MVRTINDGWRPNEQESDALRRRLQVLFAPYDERIPVIVLKAVLQQSIGTVAWLFAAAEQQRLVVAQEDHEMAEEKQQRVLAFVGNQVERQAAVTACRRSARFTPMACYRKTEEEPPVKAKVEKPIPAPTGYETLVFKLDVPPWVPPRSRWEEQHMRRIFAIPEHVVIPFEWVRLRRESGAQPILFLVALALYTSPSPPDRDASLKEIYMTVTCHLTDYDPGTLPHILSNLLSSHAIFQNDGGDWYLDFEQDPEWVYTPPPDQQDWTKTAFC